MKHKLKKKTKTQNIFFPLPQNPRFDLQKIAKDYEKHPSVHMKHRRLSRSISKQSHHKESTRSLSLKEKSKIDPKQILKKPQLNNFLKEKRVGSKGLEKQRITSNSTAQISSLFFKGMQKNLAKQCEQILKIPKPERSQSTCKLQTISRNMFLVKRKIPEPKPKEEQIVNFQTNEVIKTFLNIDPNIEPVSMMQVRSFNIFQSQNTGFRSDTSSKLEIDLIQDSQQSIIHLDQQTIKRSEELKGKRHEKKYSIMNSQTRYQKMCSSLTTTKVAMISSKFMLHSIPIFTLHKVEIMSKNPPLLAIFFQISSELIFIQIQSSEMKSLESRNKKGHSRKGYHTHVRQRSKDKILSYIQRGRNTTQLLPLYEDILHYIESFMKLSHSYIGLNLVDNSDEYFERLQLERSQQISQKLDYFYFLLKLSSTFYLLKATMDCYYDINFTFLGDFTTLSHGNQLVFAHIKKISNKTKNKSKQTLPKAAEEFKKAAELKWNPNPSNDQQVIAKVGKMQLHNLQKPIDEQTSLKWNFNKKYQMVGSTTNFFQFHDHFDMGFFNRPLSYFHLDNNIYHFNQLEPILLYGFPQVYKIFPVTQIQKQTLLISHIHTNASTLKKLTMKSFFKRSEELKKKQKESQFMMVMKNKKITIDLNYSRINIYLESLSTLRKHKISLHKSKNEKNSILDISVLSKKVETVLEQYQLCPSLLYNRLEKHQNTNIIIYYKQLHKLQNQYAFISLYKLTNIRLIQFKVYLFKLGRQFIIPLEIYDLQTERVKESVNDLLCVFKSVYFKKFLTLEMRRSQLKRKQLLEDFFKNQFKINPNSLRVKRKQHEQIRKRNVKVQSIKGHRGVFFIYETITSKIWKTKDGKECYLTIRYLPTTEVKQNKGQTKEQVLVSLHFQGKMFHFRYLTTLRQLTSSVCYQWRFLDQLDPYQILVIFKQVTKCIQFLVQDTSNKMSTIITKIKHLIAPTLTKRDMTIHPLKYTLVGKQLFESKDPITPPALVATQLSIDLDCIKDFSIASSHVLEDISEQETEWRQPHPSFGRTHKTKEKHINIPFLVDVGPHWIIYVTDIATGNQQHKIPTRKRDVRQVHLQNRQNDKCIILNPWEDDFVNTIKFSQFNKRMFRRLFRGLRKAL